MTHLFFWGGKPFFKGTLKIPKAQFWIPTNFDFDVKSPTSTAVLNKFETDPTYPQRRFQLPKKTHGASNSQLSKSQREIRSFLLTNDVGVFRWSFRELDAEPDFPQRRLGGQAFLVDARRKRSFCFFLEWKANRKFDEIHVCCFIWVYLQYTYTCWYPVVGFFCDKCRRIYHIWIWCILNSRQ